MSTSITFNGTSYTVPAIADASWGTNVANYLIAISTGCLQKTGGTFTLTAEVNFGATYGLKAAYIKTQTANTAAAGFLELAKTDTISWRNNANGADLALGIDGSDLLTFNGTALALAGLTSLTSGVTGILPIANGGTNSNATLSNNRVMYSNSGSITENAAITGNMALVSNASGLPRASTASSAELAFLVGVTSLVQTQLNAKEPTITTLGIARGGTGQGTANAAFGALSPATTKGDLLTFDTVNNRLPVGTDGQMLTASSGASTGLAWAAAASATLTQYFTDIGNASNARTATNTNLLGDIKGTTLSQTATMTIAAPGVVTSNAHGMALGDKFYFTTTGALPTGVTASTTYYASNIATNTFNISTTLANAAAGTYVTTSGTQSGTHTLVTGGLVQTSGTKGTVTNDSATAGYVGQLIESITLKSAAVSLTNSTDALVLSTAVTLTPGHWNIYGFAGFGGTSTSVAIFRAEISTGSTTPGAPPTNPYSAADSRDGYSIYGVPGGANLGNGDIIQAFPINTCKIAPGGTQTINIVAKATWTGGAVSAYGRISAVRVR